MKKNGKMSNTLIQAINVLPEQGLTATELSKVMDFSLSMASLVKRTLTSILGDIMVGKKMVINDKELAISLVEDFYAKKNENKAKKVKGRKKGSVLASTWKSIYQICQILEPYKSGIKLTELYEKYRRITYKTLNSTILDRYNSILSENLLGLDYMNRGRVRLSSDTTLLQVKSILLERYNIDVDGTKKLTDTSVDNLSKVSSKITDTEKMELRVNIATILYLSKIPLGIDEIRKLYPMRYSGRQISEVTVMSVLDEFTGTMPDLVEMKAGKYYIKEFNEVMKILKPEMATVNMVIRVPNHLNISELSGMSNGVYEIAEELSDSVIYELSTQNSSEFWKSMIKMYYKGVKILSPSSYRKKVEDIIWKALDDINTII